MATENQVPDKHQSAPPMYPMAGWVQVAPYPQQAKKKVTGLEGAAAVLGIIGMCIHWVAFFSWGLILFAVPLILAVLALTFGFISTYRMLLRDYQRENGEGTVGLAGLSLGILTLMFTISWLVLAQTYLWGWNA